MRLFRVFVVVAVFLAVFAAAGSALACGYYEEEDGNCGFSWCDGDQYYAFNENAKLGYLVSKMYRNELTEAIRARDSYYGDHSNEYKKHIEELLAAKGLGSSRLLGDMDEQYKKAMGVYYADPERCQSNGAEQVHAFLDAVAANEDAGKYLLEFVMLRHELLMACVKQDVDDAARKALREKIVELGKKPGAEEFAAYLVAAFDFYFYNDEEAKAGFKRLSIEALDKWVRETSFYMHGRTLMVQAQIEWNGYSSDLGSVDKALILEAEKIFEKYVERYPDGLYAESARNIKRRLYRLGSRKNELVSGIIGALNVAAERRDLEMLYTLATEEADKHIDYMTRGFSWDSPLVATAMLFARSTLPEEYTGNIAVQRAKFEKYPGLYSLARARILFLEKKDVELVKAFAPGKDDGAPFGDSIAMMRAIALERIGKRGEARSIYITLAENSGYRTFARDMLAASYALNEGAEGLARSFLADAKPDDAKFTEAQAMLFDRIFRDVATDKELENIIVDAKAKKPAKDAATQALLERLVLSADYEGFLKLYRAAGKPEYFAPVETAAVTLAAKPKDAKGLLNYGYFIQYNRLMPGYVYGRSGRVTTERYAYYVGKGDKELVRASHGGNEFNDPLYYYLEGLKSFEDGHKDELEGKILYHAIMCFERYGNSACLWKSGAGVDESVRKAWFGKLKKKYGNTTWGQKAKYYW